MDKKNLHAVADRMLKANPKHGFTEAPKELKDFLDDAYDLVADGETPEPTGGNELRSTQVVAALIVVWLRFNTVLHGSVKGLIKDAGLKSV